MSDHCELARTTIDDIPRNLPPGRSSNAPSGHLADSASAAEIITEVPEPMREAVRGTTLQDGPLLRIIKDRRVAFLFIGAFNTAVGFGWFVLFELTIGRLWGYMATLLFAHIASVLCAFVTHRRFVFRVKGHVWIDLVRFEMVYLVALGINALLLPLLVEVAGLSPIVSQALIVFVTTMVSYLGHSRFSFRRKATS